MPEPFSIPEEHHASFKRLLPYMSPALRTDEMVLQSLLLYLKMGNEKLARIVIDAYNETHRLRELEHQKRLREEALLRENLGQDAAGDAQFDDDEEEEDGAAEDKDETSEL